MSTDYSILSLDPSRPLQGPTPEDLRAAYPNIPTAVGWGEWPATRKVWAQARGEQWTVEETVKAMKMGAALYVVTKFPTIRDIPPRYAEKMADLLEQMEHPEFARYVAAKLGAV